MKIGNIVYEKELINHTKLDYINYYHVSNISSVNMELPTLIVGWSVVKNAYLVPYPVTILEKRIVMGKIYWEFSFDEDKSSHINGVSDFVAQLPKYYFFTNYEYLNLDVVIHNILAIEDILSKIPPNVDSIYIYRNEMIYVLYENKIIGLDMNMFRFFGFDVNEIIESIKKRCKRIFDDIDAELYQKTYKIFPNFQYLKRYMVSILTK